MKNGYIYLVFGLLFMLSFSCRKELGPIPEEQEIIGSPQANASPIGLYLLNEANMNSNKSSLDYIDFTQGIYRRNIYNQINPEVTKGLGDVGNDLMIYGAKLFAVINVSNKVEVMQANTAKKIGQINITNCRYITSHKGKVYVSAYLGTVGDANAPNGIVAEIDTTSLQITRRVEVGRQPEEMAIVGNKLYVANSGGYSPPNYENTISVIDLDVFREVKRIPVAINLHHIKADQYNDLYVTSRGDYYDIPSKLFIIDTQTDNIKKTFNIPVSDLAISGSYAYAYSMSWNYITGKNTISYTKINIQTESIESESFITDGTTDEIKAPYGIAINPQTQDIYIADAKTYLVPGELFCYNKNGKLKWRVKTGDIPAHFAFKY